MMNVPSMMPFHHAYPRPQVIAPPKKDTSVNKPITFKEVLTEKLSQKR